MHSSAPVHPYTHPLPHQQQAHQPPAAAHLQLRARLAGQHDGRGGARRRHARKQRQRPAAAHHHVLRKDGAGAGDAQPRAHLQRAAVAARRAFFGDGDRQQVVASRRLQPADLQSFSCAGSSVMLSG
jgi:hypothetical protein